MAARYEDFRSELTFIYLNQRVKKKAHEAGSTAMLANCLVDISAS